ANHQHARAGRLMRGNGHELVVGCLRERGAAAEDAPPAHGFLVAVTRKQPDVVARPETGHGLLDAVTRRRNQPGPSTERPVDRNAGGRTKRGRPQRRDAALLLYERRRAYDDAPAVDGTGNTAARMLGALGDHAVCAVA